MPNYEYRCLDCRRRFEVYLSFSEYGTKPVACPHCKSEHVERRISRVRFARSDESRLESLASPENLDGLDENPQALGRMMRQMSSELGEDMGSEFHEVVGRLEAGEAPEQIEKSMPDLGADDSGAGMGGLGGLGGGFDGLDD